LFDTSGKLIAMGGLDQTHSDYENAVTTHGTKPLITLVRIDPFLVSVTWKLPGRFLFRQFKATAHYDAVNMSHLAYDNLFALVADEPLPQIRHAKSARKMLL
jgi:hypothetical protein